MLAQPACRECDREMFSVTRLLALFVPAGEANQRLQ
jgi:hypothetical protein